MSQLFAVTGKGGVGKTTVSALLIKSLLAADKKPVLAIDADPNSCLDAALGVTVTSTVGRAREEVRSTVTGGANASLSKHEMLQLKIEEALVESEGFDLIAMGRPEGAGCYCYANDVLKGVIGELSAQYPVVVLDNEAGLENLSRRIVQKVDVMILVSDAGSAGLQTLVRLYELANEMEMKYGKLVLVINRIRGGKLPEQVKKIQEITSADIVIGLPDDETVAIFSEESRRLLDIPDDNPVYRKVQEILS